MGDENEVLLSAKLVRDWKAEYEALTAEQSALVTHINDLQKQHTELGNKAQKVMAKIYGAVPFLPELSQWIQEQQFNSSGDNATLTKAILKSLAQFPPGHAMNRQQIPQQVQRFGYPQQKLTANPNYLYIALKRLTDRKLLEEVLGGSFRLTETGRMEAQKN